VTGMSGTNAKLRQPGQRARGLSAADRVAAPAGLPVVLAGGLFGDARLETAVRILIDNARPGSDVRALPRPPVTGAVRLAQAVAQAGGSSGGHEGRGGGAGGGGGGGGGPPGGGGGGPPHEGD
jgi:uncharacterized membrane protein YgcG